MISTALDRLLGELLTRFLEAPGGSPDEEIRRAQRRVCELLALDRSSLWHAAGGADGPFVLTHHFGPSLPATMEPIDARELFPWALERVLRGDVVAVSRLADLPAEAARDRESWREHGTMSSLVFPLATGPGQVFGALAFAAVDREIEWDRDAVQALQVVAQLFALAIKRHASEKTLELSDERYRQAARAARFGTWDVDLLAGTGYWSPEIPTILGLPSGAPLPPSGSGGLPADAERVMDALRRPSGFDESGVLTAEFRIVWPDGSVHWLELCGQVQFSEAGAGRRPVRYIGTLLDITERRHAEWALLQRNQFIETILEQAPIGFAVHTIDDGVGRFVSARFEEIYGCARGTIVSHDSFFEAVWPRHPELREQIRARVAADMASGDPGRMRWEELPVILPSGETRYVTAMNIPLSDQNLMVSTVQDVTDRVRAERRLRESELRFRQVAESVTDFIWEVDAEGLYTYTSPSVERILGYTPEELVGKVRFSDLFVEASREELKAAAGAVFAARQPFRAFANANVRKDGRVIHLETSGVPLLDADGSLRGYRGADTDVTDRIRAEELLRSSYVQVEAQKDRLQAERDYLEKRVIVADTLGLVGESESFRQMLAQVEQVGPTGASVLIMGETGTGKERIAHAIHATSARRDRLMVTVNCAALPVSLIESELFGHEKGAFTGAIATQIGRFELADGSTLFLDEISELPLDLQAKLLRVLEEGQFERLGSPRPRQADVRVIAATNRDLSEEVRKGRFRADLYYRLNVFPIRIAPLRDRPEDIRLLVWLFADHFGKLMGKAIESIPRETMEALQRQRWPGNVRELRNVIERAVILSTDSVLAVPLPGGHDVKAEDESLTLEDVERRHINRVLSRTNWRIAGEGGAARLLGVKRTTLQSKLKKLGISR